MDETTTSTTTTGNPTETAPVISNSGSNAAGVSQDEVNKLVGKARVEARESARKALLAELGFEDFDAVKSLVSSAKAKEDAEKTETQKLADKLAAETTARQAAEARAAQVEQERQQDRRNAAILNAATLAKAEEPQDVVDWAEKNAKSELDAILDAEGKVDAAKVTALVEKARAARPTWFGVRTGPGSPSNAGGRGVDLDKAGKLDAARRLQTTIRKGF